MNRTRHADDAALLRLVDGESGPDETAALRDHLSACTECRDRLETIEARDRRVRAWLEAHDAPPPARADYTLAPIPPARHRRPARRWLAAASVVLAVALVAGPARGWMLDRIGLGADQPSVEASTPPDGATTAFATSAPTLRLEIRGADAPRYVTVERSTDALVHVVAADDATELLVRPSGVQITDRSQGSRTYHVRVPQAVLRVRVVRASTGLDSLVTLSAQATRTQIDLGGHP